MRAETGRVYDALRGYRDAAAEQAPDAPAVGAFDPAATAARNSRPQGSPAASRARVLDAARQAIERNLAGS